MGQKQNAGIRCPSCATMMYRVPTEGPEIDLCRCCQMIWFDGGELEDMPMRSEAERAEEQKVEAAKRERIEWRRRRERDVEFLEWLRRHPIGFIS